MSLGQSRRPGNLVGWLGPALAVSATLALSRRHVSGYYPLFDDFAIFGALPDASATSILLEPHGGFYRPLGLALMKLEALLFGLAHPAGLAAVSVALHAANALLLALLLHRAGCPAARRWAAVALFLASPWSGEAFFWASAQFDLLATLFVLVTLLATLAATRQEELWHAVATAVAATAALAALACKESGVAVAPMAFLVIASFRDREPSALRRAAPVAVTLVAVTGAFLALRSRLLPGFEGPYGDFATLVSGGAGVRNFLSHLEAFLRLPFSATGPLLAGLQAIWGTGVLLVLLRSLRRDTLGTALRLLALAVSLAPVTPLATGAAAIPSGRLLYLPGLVLVLALAGSPRDHRPTWFDGVAANLLLALALVSLAWQQALWHAACALSRHVVAAVTPYVVADRPIYVRNLPLRFEAGPHVLKSYAFRFAFRDRTVPPVRAEGVVLERNPRRLRIVGREVDPFSEGSPQPDDQQLVLPLDDSWLR